MTNHVIEVPFHIGDFVSGTMHMDALEIGAYWMLCVAHYQAGVQGLPDDDTKLSRIAKVTPKVWKKIRPTIAEKFEIKDNFWRSKKVVEILLKILERSSIAKAKSLKRWNSGDAAALPQESHGNPNHITNKKEEEKEEKIPQDKPEKKVPRETEKKIVFEGDVVRLNGADFDSLQSKSCLTKKGFIDFLDEKDRFYATLAEHERANWWWRLTSSINQIAERNA